MHILHRHMHILLQGLCTYETHTPQAAMSAGCLDSPALCSLQWPSINHRGAASAWCRCKCHRKGATLLLQAYCKSCPVDTAYLSCTVYSSVCRIRMCRATLHAGLTSACKNKPLLGGQWLSGWGVSRNPRKIHMYKQSAAQECRGKW